MDPIDAWLAEDGAGRDVTTLAVVPEDAQATARILAREALVVAGLGPASQVFVRLGCKVLERLEDGARVEPGAAVLTVEGPGRAILSGERLALNLVGRLSGIATATDVVVRAVSEANPRCAVLATRKTTPGLRRLEHAAVRAGGGAPHRGDLEEAYLVKENHLAFASVAEAVERAREADPSTFLVVEAETPEEALEVARAGADGVLLDNFPPERLADTASLVRSLAPEIVVEASGGITLENAAAYAPHVDRLSLGALTHSARAVDLSLELLSR